MKRSNRLLLFGGAYRIAHRFELFNYKVGKELKKLPKEWTGNLVGLMHNKGITNIRLAEKLGVTDRYVSMVLNSKREPPEAEGRFTQAVMELITSQEQTHNTT